MAYPTLPQDPDVGKKLDLLLSKVDAIEARLADLEGGPAAREPQAQVAKELQGPVELALAGMTDDMVKQLVRRISALAEVVLDPGVASVLERLDDPAVVRTLTRVTDPQVLEPLEGLTGVLALVQSGLTDDMVKGLVRKVTVLGELVLDPFVLDALQTVARALKAGQAQYPDVKVAPVGGIFGALRAANDPDTRRVMAFALAVLQNLGRQFA